MYDALISELIMIEDDRDDAKSYVRHLEELFSNVEYVTNFDELSNCILDGNPNIIFWVDINLGIGREKDGLEMIKIIVQNCPKALIIVQSGNGDYESECLARGATHFFRKGDFEENIAEIRKIIEGHLALNGLEVNITRYFAQIAHINEEEGWVKLEFCLNGGFVEKIFSIKTIVWGVGEDLAVDDWVEIKVVEKLNEYKATFTKGTKPEFMIENDEDESEDDSDLIYSKVWGF